VAAVVLVDLRVVPLTRQLLATIPWLRADDNRGPADHLTAVPNRVSLFRLVAVDQSHGAITEPGTR
jgi:hypothetical protein